MKIAIKIISGGQTGVDRGALDAALDCGAPCGGWCPPGRLDESGVIPIRYPVKAIKRAKRGGGFRERTLCNIQDADGTVIIYFDELEGGTAETVYFCINRNKPFKLIDGAEVSVARATELLITFTSLS